MNIGITTITDNIGMHFDKVMVLLAGAGGLCFYGKDFKLGIIMHFIAFGLLFLWFYNAGYEYTLPLILMFSFLVLLSLSMYFGFGSSQSQGIL